MTCERCQNMEMKMERLEASVARMSVLQDKLDNTFLYVEHLRNRIRGYKAKYEDCKDPGDQTYAPVQKLRPVDQHVDEHAAGDAADGDPETGGRT